MSETASSFAQRGGEHIHFKHEDMDYYLSWIMGRQIFGAADGEECLATAARITDGDPESWRIEWLKLAEVVEGRALASLSNASPGNSATQWMQACSYYRAAMFIMEPTDGRFRPAAEAMRRCFQEALALVKPDMESVEIEYQNKKLPGYYLPAEARMTPAPTLIVIGGIETFAEDCYFMIGPAALQQGYNLLTVDLPGQGLTPDDGLHFGARMEQPMKVVLDLALGRPEVNASRVAIYGFSWGGHIVFKAARYDSRVKAMIANPPMPNVFRAALAQQGGHDRSDPIAQTVFKQIAWRMGLKISFNPIDIARRFGKAYDYLFHGKVNPADIEPPTLCLAGQAEPDITLEIAEECRRSLPHPLSEVRIFSDKDGSSAHCQVDNLDVPNQAIFQWLNMIWGE